MHDAVFDIGYIKLAVTLGGFSNILIVISKERKSFVCSLVVLEAMKVTKGDMLVDFFIKHT